MAAAGDVASDGVDGAYDLADGYTGFDVERPGAGKLFFGDGADVFGGVLYRAEKDRPGEPGGRRIFRASG